MDKISNFFQNIINEFCNFFVSTMDLICNFILQPIYEALFFPPKTKLTKFETFFPHKIKEIWKFYQWSIDKFHDIFPWSIYKMYNYFQQLMKFWYFFICVYVIYKISSFFSVSNSEIHNLFKKQKKSHQRLFFSTD